MAEFTATVTHSSSKMKDFIINELCVKNKCNMISLVFLFEYLFKEVFILIQKNKTLAIVKGSQLAQLLLKL